MAAIFALLHRHWLLSSAAALLLVSGLSLTPLPHLPSAPGGDKLHHLLAYACVMFPTALRKPRSIALWSIAFLAWSGGVELLQPLVNRYADWRDLAANGAGLCLGLVAGRFAARWLQRQHADQGPIHK